MLEAPIVEEIHRTREKLAAEYGFDVKRMFVALRKREAALGGRLVLQKNAPNQRPKLTGAAFLALPVPPPPRRPRQLSLNVRHKA